MSVIRHWVAYDPTDDKIPHVMIRDERELDDHRAYGWTIEGPFVHADQLTGAVKALEEIKANEGKVCESFMECTHRACQSSVSAWMIADAYLTGRQPGVASSSAPEEDNDLDVFLSKPTVGYCSKCGEARTAMYACRDGGETLPLALPRTDQTKEDR